VATIRWRRNPEIGALAAAANDDGMKVTFVQVNEKRRIVGRFVLVERYREAEAWARRIIATCWTRIWERFAGSAKWRRNRELSIQIC